LKLCVFMPPLFLIFKGSYVMSPYFQILKFPSLCFHASYIFPNFKGSNFMFSCLLSSTFWSLKLCVFMPPLFLTFKGSYVMSPYFQILKFQVCVFMPLPIFPNFKGSNFMFSCLLSSKIWSSKFAFFMTIFPIQKVASSCSHG
jgi:hypothetical protein